MASLAACIRNRDKETASLFGSKDGGDDGHRHFLEMLNVCLPTLQRANRIAATFYTAKQEDEKARQAIGGRFNPLIGDEEEVEEEMNWKEMDRDIR